MKILKSFALLFAAMAIISCGDDDSPSAPAPVYELTAESILGSYNLTELVGEQNEVITLNNDGAIVSEDTIDYEVTTIDDAVIEFLADGTFALSGGYVYVTDDGTNDPDSDIISLTGITGTYVLDIENKEITLVSTNDQFNGDYVIETFKEKSMKFTQEDEEVSIETTTSTTTTTEFSYSFERE